MKDIEKQFYSKFVRTRETPPRELEGDAIAEYIDEWIGSPRQVLAFIDSLIKEAREEERKDIIIKTNNLYTEFEDKTPPLSLSVADSNWNDGLYKGQLKAMERICVDVLGLSDGEELEKLADTSATKTKLKDKKK